jgi:hypothetical protein
MGPRNLLNVLSGFLKYGGSSPTRPSDNLLLTPDPDKRDLILTFRTITSLINILQPTLIGQDSPSDLDGTLSDGPDRARELRILTALAIVMCRRREVTAVVANDPRIHSSNTLQVVATRPEDLDPAQVMPRPDLRRHTSFIALQNPHPSHPAYALSSDGTFGVLTPSIEFDVSTPLDSVLTIWCVHLCVKFNAVY